VQRLRYFLLGKRFKLETDHFPLISIFGKSLDISRRASQRIARWALILSQYNFEIMHTPGDRIPHVDALTRLQYVSNPSDELVFFSDLGSESLNDDTVLDSVSEVAQLLSQDQFYIAIKKRIINSNWRSVTPLERQFARAKQFLTVENDLIYHKNRLFIPEAFRSKILSVIHDNKHIIKEIQLFGGLDFQKMSLVL